MTVRSTTDGAGPSVPLWRLHLLRAAYLLMIVGLAVAYLPNLFVHSPRAPGQIVSILSGFWVMAWFGLRYPLRMIPLLLLDFVWKSVWVLAFGLPLWRAGLLTPDTSESFRATVLGVVLMPIVLPWGYVWRHYVIARGDRWAAALRRAADAGAPTALS